MCCGVIGRGAAIAEQTKQVHRLWFVFRAGVAGALRPRQSARTVSAKKAPLRAAGATAPRTHNFPIEPAIVPGFRIRHMAKITFGPSLSEARGKAADTVYTKTRGGNVAKALSLTAAGVGPHNLLSLTHPDTTPATPPTRGSLITGQAAVTLWKELLLGTSGHFLKSDGVDALWSALPSPAYPGSGAITISQSAMPATLNLSTEGTFDWWAPAGVTTLYRVTAPAALHTKILGGWIVDGYNWLHLTNSTLFTQASSIQLSTTAGDDTASPLTNYATDQGLWTASGTLTGFGFAFRVPADTASRTLRIYCACFSAVVTLKARLSDGSVADTTDTLTSGANANATTQWNIAHHAAHDGAWLCVQATVTTNKGSSPNIKFAAATLF